MRSRGAKPRDIAMAKWRLLAFACLALAFAGCNGLPSLPTWLAPAADVPVAPVGEANPVFIELGHRQYGYVFEACLSALLDEGFEIMESNRYDGRIETRPRVAPGILNILKRGSPDLRERVLATTQTYRHRVSLNIQPADNSGYFIEVIVRKELEDMPQPVRSSVGAAVFRSEQSVERQYEVIDPIFLESNWIYKGRDTALEQDIIRRLVNCLSSGRG
jgi:hypothetical protein